MITVPVERDIRPREALEAALRRQRLRFRSREIGLVRSHPIDIVFANQGVAVDVRSCYWHGCPEHSPTEQDAEMREVISRDALIVSDLRRFGWTVIIVWEHEDPSDAAFRIAQAVRGRTNGGA